MLFETFTTTSWNQFDRWRWKQSVTNSPKTLTYFQDILLLAGLGTRFLAMAHLSGLHIFKPCRNIYRFIIDKNCLSPAPTPTPTSTSAPPFFPAWHIWKNADNNRYSYLRPLMQNNDGRNVSRPIEVFKPNRADISAKVVGRSWGVSERKEEKSEKMAQLNLLAFIFRFPIRTCGSVGEGSEVKEDSMKYSNALRVTFRNHH